MSFPQYPEYKDSGLEWLGEVPAHWETWKVAHAFGSIGSGTTPPSSEEHWYDEVGMPWVTTGELRENIIVETNKSVTTAALEKFSALRIHPAGSLVVAMYGATIGRLGILGVDAVTNQACCVLSAPRSLSIAFTYYWLQGFKQIIIDLFSTGGGQPNINQDTVANLRIPAPGLGDQTAIATFLDRETAKIDALVAEQEKLIALLQEKRQAVISDAVTKGLDSNVPMKDSGVEWLGEVPTRWQVKQLRHVARVVRGASPRPAGDPRFFSRDYSDESNIPWVTVAEITKDEGLYLTEVTEYLTPLGAAASQQFRRGTVIFSNSGATLGVPKILAIDCCANDGVVAFRELDQQVSPEFLFFFLSTTTERLRTEMKQGGGQPNLNTDIVKNIGFAVPPLEEQKAIVMSIQLQTARFNDLINAAQQGVAFLHERRTALISAAVTGQIDVRSIAPVEAA